MQAQSETLNNVQADEDIAPLTRIEEEMPFGPYLKSLGQDEHFYPDTPAKIDWVFKTVSVAETEAESTLAGARAEAQAYRDLADRIEANGQKRADDILRRVHPLIRMFGPAIAKTAESLILERGKGMSLVLDYGVVKVTKNTKRYAFAKLNSDDENVAVEWAQAVAPASIVTKPTLNRTLLGDLVDVEVKEAVDESTGGMTETVQVTLKETKEAVPAYLVEIKPERRVEVSTGSKWEIAQ